MDVALSLFVLLLNHLLSLFRTARLDRRLWFILYFHKLLSFLFVLRLKLVSGLVPLEWQLFVHFRLSIHIRVALFELRLDVLRDHVVTERLAVWSDLQLLYLLHRQLFEDIHLAELFDVLDLGSLLLDLSQIDVISTLFRAERSLRLVWDLGGLVRYQEAP